MLFTYKGLLTSPCILWNSTFRWIFPSFSPSHFTSLSNSAICKASSDNHFAFLFSWGWFSSLLPVQCYKPLSIVLQALCLSELTPWFYLSLLLYNYKGWFGSYLNVLVIFPFFSWSLNFQKGDMIWATVSFQSCFYWLYRASPSLAAKNIINLISVLTSWWCLCVQSCLTLLEEHVCYDQCVLLAKLC